LGGGIVVVMAERDKEEMEMDIAKMEFDFKGTSVICRSGSPLILADLKKVCMVSVILLISCNIEMSSLLKSCGSGMDSVFFSCTMN
jgi:hypothetical protein